MRAVAILGDSARIVHPVVGELDLFGQVTSALEDLEADGKSTPGLDNHAHEVR